jgi:N-acylglucosamine-6-phosphate 2-epimerase
VTLERLRGGLIVSIQPEEHSALNRPDVVALLARCAVANGAAGVRIEGVERIAAVRAAVDVPIVGLVKRHYPGFEPYISPTAREIAEILGSGARIVAFDATPRPRPDGTDVAGTVAAIAAGGGVAMADCATAAEMRAAAAAGAAIVATTLCGYTDETAGAALPAVDLVPAARSSGAFVIVEGGIGSPAGVERAFAAGADAVVVGTAISNVDALVRRFAQAAPRRRAYPIRP